MIGRAELPRTPAARLSQRLGARVLNHTYPSTQSSDAGGAAILSALFFHADYIRKRWRIPRT
jgi:hypothetical protein